MVIQPRLVGSMLFKGPPDPPGYPELTVPFDLGDDPPTVTVAAAFLGSSGKHEVVAEVTGPSGNIVGRKVDRRDEPESADAQWVSAMAVLFFPTEMGPHRLSLQVDGVSLAHHRVQVVPRPVRGLSH
jgi:hypothetical protein